MKNRIKKFCKAAILRDIDFKHEIVILNIILVDGEKYTKEQVKNLLIKYKNKKCD